MVIKFARNKILLGCTLTWAIIAILLLFKIPLLLPIASVLFWGNIILTVFYLLNFLNKKYEILSFWKNNTFTLNLFYLFILLGNVFVYAFMQRENYVYYWDFAAYWLMSIEYSNIFLNDLAIALKNLYLSILQQEYSLTPTILLSLPIKILGNNFDSYVLSIYNVYIIPFYFLFISLFMKILHDNDRYSSANLLLVSLLVFIFPPILSPLMNGYLDSIGLSFVVIILMITYHDNYIKFDLKRNLFLAFLIVIFLFTRRWYGYWAVIFFFSLFITNLFRLLFDREYTKNNFSSFILNMTFIGSISVLTIILFFRDFFVRSVFNNHMDAYLAYRGGTIWDNIIRIVEYFGLFPTFIMLIGIIIGIANKKTRYFSLFVFIHSILTFYAFIRINNFGVHHYYLLATSFLVFFLSGLIFLKTVLKYKKLQFIMSGVIVFFMLSNFIQTFIPKKIEVISMTKPVLSQFTAYPKVRHDLVQLQNLVVYLNELTKGTSKKVYVVSSSKIINDDILRRVNMPGEFNAVPALYTTNHVDRRDGFPDQFLLSDYIVVADPIQYHLRPEDQRVVGVLADGILRKEGFGQHYKIIKSFSLDTGVIAKVYEKVEPYEKKSIGQLNSLFFNLYPHHQNLKEITGLFALITDKQLGDIYGVITTVAKGELFLHPGNTTPTSFILKLNQQFKTLKFKAQISEEVLKQVGYNEKFGEVYISIYNGDKILCKKYIKMNELKEFVLETSELPDIKIVVDNGKYGPGYDQVIISDFKLE